MLVLKSLSTFLVSPTNLLQHHNQSFSEFDADRDYREAFNRRQGGHEAADDLPPYIIDDTTEAANYRGSHPGGYKVAKLNVDRVHTDAHSAAVHGKFDELERILALRRTTKNTAAQRREEIVPRVTLTTTPTALA